MADRFPSPFEMTTPSGAEGWEQLYGYSTVFSEDRREYEDSMFWFMDGVHTPEVIEPWDATIMDFAIIVLGQYNTRHYVIPPALGVDIRYLNGYMYLSPVGVADPAEIGARVPEFAERAGYYFGHWDTLYDAWMDKIKGVIGELAAIRFTALPHREDMAVLTEGRGIGSGALMLKEYDKLVELTIRLWNHHFEFLNLGYAAYLDFFGFCKQLFPSIPDQGIAKMVAGIDVDLFRPDEELKKLAQLAVDLGVDDRIDRSAHDTLARMGKDDDGSKWVEAWEAAHDPWFNFSAGSGFYHSDRIWRDYPDIPMAFIANYVTALGRGESLARPVAAIEAERDRIVEEYRDLIEDDGDRATFDDKLGLARTVFPYVENHNFYVEHWGMSQVWGKMRELGAVLTEAGFFGQPDDIFLLRRTEVPDAIFDYYHGWAVGIESRGPKYWGREIHRRKAIMDALRTWSPPPALGAPPEVITEPFTVMLWGVTSESVKQWLGGGESDDGSLHGFAASPGVAEGPARVIFSADGIADLQDGEILVAPLTAPSWAPVFGRIGATVTDVGGIMSHAAIVCREYGLPAVTGTAFGTKKIRTGQRIRVDGNAGTVTVLD
ncbi:MAG TPA: PEP-utilizing enzyme [Jatrophihabitans sp.]|jgi:pyruvate,water dikinase|uniref:PEP-utilizing enzyme n=1 Tax=Jatrophihabitans sp. TaxID=1932789 RepID=UPI002E03D0BE|nr:PEP-utilizing enzyme [Jatrophihabitans sp.]